MDQDSGAPVGPPPSTDDQAKQLADMTRFFDHETALHRALRAADRCPEEAANVVIGIGVDSAHLVTSRTSAALAELLGVEPVDFPGDHGGFIGAPGAFADRLREIIRSGPRSAV